MASEKLRYIKRGPSPIIERNELKKHLVNFSSDNLIDTIWQSAESNLHLWKALNGHIGMIKANGNWQKTKDAIDYALHFEDIISCKEHGHEIIIYEMIKALNVLFDNVSNEFALKAATYILEQGREQLYSFEDDWSWSCALGNIEEWLASTSSDK